MEPQLDWMSIILAGGQLTLVVLAARLAFSFGRLSQQVEGILKAAIEEKKIIDHLMHEGDYLRERVMAVEVRLENLTTSVSNHLRDDGPRSH